MMMRCQAAPRPEGKSVARAIVLHLHVGHHVGLGPRHRGRVADRKLTDPARRRQVALNQRRRNRQHLRIVVKALSIRVIRRQEGLDVHFETDQIAHGVLILDPVEAMRRHRAAQKQMGGRCAVQLRLQPGDQGGARGVVGPPRPRWRHHPAPHFSHHLFPKLRAGADLLRIEVESLQRPSAPRRADVGYRYDT